MQQWPLLSSPTVEDEWRCPWSGAQTSVEVNYRIFTMTNWSLKMMSRSVAIAQHTCTTCACSACMRLCMFDVRRTGIVRSCRGFTQQCVKIVQRLGKNIESHQLWVKYANTYASLTLRKSVSPFLIWHNQGLIAYSLEFRILRNIG